MCKERICVSLKWMMFAVGETGGNDRVPTSFLFAAA